MSEWGRRVGQSVGHFHVPCYEILQGPCFVREVDT
jgi:hypothetical protein